MVMSSGSEWLAADCTWPIAPHKRGERRLVHSEQLECRLPQDHLGVFDAGGRENRVDRTARIAEGAFLVRIVGRPHHGLGADAMQELEARRGRPRGGVP